MRSWKPILAAAFVAASQLQGQQDGEWRAYGRDAFDTRYSPLAQVTRDNVASLKVAWVFHTGELNTMRETRFEATPLVVDGTLYLSTPFGKLIALDPVTGHERWRYDAHVDPMAGFGDFANRGVSTWVDRRTAATAACHRRIYLPTVDGRIIALDARTGALCASFGSRGVVNLRAGLRNTPFEYAEYEVTSPPAIVHDLVITGSAVADNNRTNAASGEVRAYDARTGALRWSWDPVPRDSTDSAYDSWQGVMAHSTGAANAWSVLAVDSARDLVFVPTSSPSPDYYGGERRGDNHYANSIVALHASTGRVAWHFQTVHHDLWDYDNASPPALVTITHDGRRVDVVLQGNKDGQLFVLDRDTGKPVFPVEERAVPQSTLLGERTSHTQPFNTVLPPLSPQALALDSVWGITPADRDSCVAQIQPMRNDGVFTPPSLQGTVVRPSNIGGAHWGGVAFDPTHQLAIVPVNTVASMVQLIPLDQVDTIAMHRDASRLGDQYTRMHGTPYVMRRRILISPLTRLPCAPPPWGSLVALDLQTGRKVWDVPLGDPRNLMPALASALPANAAPFGLPNLGGPIVTAGGVVFIGAAFDHFIRAFDVETGRELWRGELPAGARATPVTYAINGKQYVAISVGGSDDWGKSDAFVVFALP
jgi:quinoprotein glucose dehydrogenase